MAAELEEAGDRLVLYLDPGGPMDLAELTDSFAALARMYARHYRSGPDAEAAPKLYVTKLSTGSVWAEIAPYAVLLGQTYALAAGMTTVGDFTNRVTSGLKAFANPGLVARPLLPVSRDDASDLREFIKPLTGRKGARLGISHARYAERSGDREVVVEYAFDETEINRAALSMDRDLEALPEKPSGSTDMKLEVLLYFEVASRSAGKEKGKTADRAIVPEVTDKPLPTYFRKGVSGDPKDQMVRAGGTNPLGNVGYIVDVAVQKIDDEPRVYIVTHVHETVPLDGG